MINFVVEHRELRKIIRDGERERAQEKQKGFRGIEVKVAFNFNYQLLLNHYTVLSVGEQEVYISKDW